MGRKWTTCKKCNRVLWEEDADENGLCPDCRAVQEEDYEKPTYRGRKSYSAKDK